MFNLVVTAFPHLVPRDGDSLFGSDFDWLSGLKDLDLFLPQPDTAPGTETTPPPGIDPPETTPPEKETPATEDPNTIQQDSKPYEQGHDFQIEINQSGTQYKCDLDNVSTHSYRNT